MTEEQVAAALLHKLRGLVAKMNDAWSDHGIKMEFGIKQVDGGFWEIGSVNFVKHIEPITGETNVTGL